MVHSYTSNGTITLYQSIRFYTNDTLLFKTMVLNHHHCINLFIPLVFPFIFNDIILTYQCYKQHRPLVSFFHTKVLIILTHWYYPFRPLHLLLSTNGTPPKSTASIFRPLVSFFPNFLCILNFLT